MPAIQWIVCMRVDQAHIVVQSSQQQHCAGCNTKIWVSPNTNTLISADVPRVCTSCALAFVKGINEPPN